MVPMECGNHEIHYVLGVQLCFNIRNMGLLTICITKKQYQTLLNYEQLESVLHSYGITRIILSGGWRMESNIIIISSLVGGFNPSEKY